MTADAHHATRQTAERVDEAHGLGQTGRFPLDDETRAEALKLLRELRAAGIPAEMEFEARSMKAQLKRANRVEAALAVIVGGDELARGEVLVRDMRLGEDSSDKQRAVARASAIEAIRTRL